MNYIEERIEEIKEDIADKRYQTFIPHLQWFFAAVQYLMQKNERLRSRIKELEHQKAKEPKVCADCITNHHAICQWEKEYAPGCVCGCHISIFNKPTACAHCDGTIPLGNCFACGTPMALSAQGELETGEHVCSSDCPNPECSSID